MRVLQINATYGAGSTGTIVADIHNLLLSKGYESFVAYSSTNVNAEKIVNGYKIGGKLGKKAHALLCRIGGKQGYFSRYSTKRLISFIKEKKPDVVHLHNLHSNYINLNILFSFLGKERIKTVITLHDCWFYTGGCSHYTSVRCMRWQTGCGECPRRYDEIPAYIYDGSAKVLKGRKDYFDRIDDLTVVGVSKWISDEARKSVLKDKKIVTIYNGVDTDFFKPTASDLKKELGIENKFMILGIANKWLDPINKSVLEKVLSSLSSDMALVIMGCSEKQKDNLPCGVISLPFLNREELRKVYSAADVFANCTREESFSLVNIESQICGTPVVTFANTGAKETVSDEYGIKVETGNSSDFMKGINAVYKKGKAAFSSGCASFVHEYFDKEKNYMKYLNLYLGGEK